MILGDILHIKGSTKTTPHSIVDKINPIIVTHMYTYKFMHIFKLQHNCIMYWIKPEIYQN